MLLLLKLSCRGACVINSVIGSTFVPDLGALLLKFMVALTGTYGVRQPNYPV